MDSATSPHWREIILVEGIIQEWCNGNRIAFNHATCPYDGVKEYVFTQTTEYSLFCSNDFTTRTSKLFVKRFVPYCQFKSLDDASAFADMLIRDLAKEFNRKGE